MNAKPFFSFLFITYNQECYVKEAFDACLSQTFEDYEIVISDDKSTDNTWNVLNDLVTDYRKQGGTINIVLHQNITNLGIVGNFQSAAELSRGKWLLMAAGDDISLPNRLEIVKGVIVNHPNAYGINTGCFFVDENSDNPKYNFCLDYLLGADSVWHRDLFNVFPKVTERVMSEDHVLNLRALLMGEIVQVNTATIKYRISNSNVSLQKSQSAIDEKKFQIKKKTYLEAIINVNFRDLESFSHIREVPQKTFVIDKLQTKLAESKKIKESYQYYIDVSESNLLKQLVYIFRPSDLWLHCSFFYRIVSIMKMHGLLPNKHSIKTIQPTIYIEDNKEYTITLNDYINPDRINLY